MEDPVTEAGLAETGGSSGRVSPREWRGLLVATLLLLALADLPFVLAAWDPPPGYTAVYPNIVAAEDYPQYVGAIREAARTGSLLSTNHFSTEPHRRVMARPFYAAIGVVGGAWLGVDPVVAYHVAAHVGRFVMVIGIYLFAALCFVRPRDRILALATVFLLSGLSWCLELGEGRLPPWLLGRYAEGVERSEFSTFLTLFHHPHLTLALGLLFLAARLVVRLLGDPGVRRAALLGLVVFLLSITNLFSLATIGTACLLFFALDRWVVGRVRAGGIAAVAAAGLAGLPYLVYAVGVFRADPFWSATYGAAAGQEAPPPDVVVLHLLPVLLLAGIGARGFFRGAWVRGEAGECQEGSSRRWAAAWLVACGILLFLPIVRYPLRAAFGLHPMLAFPASSGLRRLAGMNRPKAVRVALLVPIAVVAVLPPLLFGRLLLRSTRGEVMPHLLYRLEAEVAAARWLEERTGPADAVFASYESGNFLAGWIPGRVYLGHGTGTLRPEEKQAEVDAFFGGTSSAESKRSFLEAQGIDYVFFGPYEQYRTTPESFREFGRFLDEAFRSGPVAVFRLRPAP